MEKHEVQFQIGDLLPIGMTIVVLGIALAYGLQVMGDVKADMTANSMEANATEDAITAVAKLPEKLPTIVTVVVAAVIIGILITYLAGRFMK
jgi:Na+-transporting methylmalonyl-CoA/oxaloacetate decarboxylase gamma subunit